MEHLVAVAQLLGHHPQDPELLLLVLRPGEGQLVLLDGAELGRRLGADGAQQMGRLLRVQIGGAGPLGLALGVAALDLVADAQLAKGAELEPAIAREVLLPVVDQEVVVGQEGLPPLDDRVVELGG